jgi:hypothetical protein
MSPAKMQEKPPCIDIMERRFYNDPPIRPTIRRAMQDNSVAGGDLLLIRQLLWPRLFTRHTGESRCPV